MLFILELYFDFLYGPSSNENGLGAFYDNKNTKATKVINQNTYFW